MADKKQNTEFTQTTIELTGYKILDLAEKLGNDLNAINICSKAFDHIAPSGEKLEVQIKVTRGGKDFLPDGVDMLELYEAE